MPRVFSTRVFFIFLVVAYINVLGDIIQSAVFDYLDNTFSSLRGISQIIYVGTLIICAFVMALYVYAKILHGKKASPIVIGLIAAPGVIGLISLLFGRVNYTVTESGQYYNVGFVVLLCYFIGFLYIFGTMLLSITFRDRLRKDDALAITAGLLAWAILAFFQFKFHGYQVSSIAIMLMSLILFLSSENPREYYEKDIPGVKNEDAFDLVITERFGLSKSFFIVSVIFTGKTMILNGEDRKKLYSLQGEIAKMAEEATKESSYLSSWNTLSYIIENPESVEQLMTLINNYKDDSGSYKLTYAVLEVPKHTKKADEALQILRYVSGEYIYTHYSPNLVIDNKIIDKMVYRNTIEDVVRAAVKDKAFEVYYQPILSVKEGKFISTEALVRLKRADSDNYISPEDFIPIAEKCGLIQEIDDLVFEKVCSFIARENLSSYGIRKVEVNLSGNEVVDRKTYARLIGKMEKYHIPAKMINFEITETAYINNDDAFKHNVQKLKELGSTFSMDDFGSGYSNLLELLKMDYVMVKMDKEFIWNCMDLDKPENMRMLEYSINFLKDYGLHVLAEGVETIEQAKTLIEKGVEYLQGFYYSRPLPENEYIEFLKAQKGDRL